MFIISDNKGNYIKRKSCNNRSVTTKLEEAEQFNQLTKAENVISALSRTLKVGHEWRAERFSSSGILNAEYKKVSLDELKDKVKDAAEILATYRGNKDYLIDMLSEADKEISDILHYIEFFNFSASDGYKLSKALKDVRLRRREIKNQIEIIEYINSSTGTSISEGHLNRQLEAISEKQYTPRVLNELFESRTKKN